MIKYLLGVIRAVLPILFGTIRCSYMSHHREKYSLEQRYAAARKIIIKVNRAFRTRINIEGKENINDEHKNGRIYFCNHRTVFDVLIMIELSEKPLIFISKKENAKVPFLSTVCKCIDVLYIDRKDVRQSLRICKQAGELSMNEGRDICIFPEGTRSKGDSVLEFKAALVSIVGYSKNEVVMVCLHNSKKPLKFRWITYPKEYVNVKVFKPIAYDYICANKKAFNEEARKALQEQYELFERTDSK